MEALAFLRRNDDDLAQRRSARALVREASGRVQPFRPAGLSSRDTFQPVTHWAALRKAKQVEEEAARAKEATAQGALKQPDGAAQPVRQSRKRTWRTLTEKCKEATAKTSKPRMTPSCLARQLESGLAQLEVDIEQELWEKLVFGDCGEDGLPMQPLLSGRAI